MKAWQKGYDIEELKHWVEKFKNFNQYCHSPFLEAKKKYNRRCFRKRRDTRGEQCGVYDENCQGLI